MGYFALRAGARGAAQNAVGDDLLRDLPRGDLALENARFTLRPIAPEDRDHLLRVYASTREEELALTDWGEAQKAEFLAAQFAAQDTWYRERYPGATLDVVEVGGEPAGRLYVHRREREIRLMDIALLPPFRGAGLGTAILEELFAEAAAAGKTLTIHVEMYNPALRLYERLGFRKIGEHGVYQLMEWAPPQVKTAS